MAVKEKKYGILPYFCVFIDAEWAVFLKAIKESLQCSKSSELLVDDITKLWRTSKTNHNHILPCLSVRSGFDLYLQIRNFPLGSEIIMSAINIPDMVRLIQHHGLKVIPLDISIATAAPKVELLESLITSRTVAILVAHIYGIQIKMEPIIKIAKKYKILMIEDCAECFCGLQNLSHPDTDLSLYSFGPIKFFTSFGGGISIIKDESIYRKMAALQNSYPIQSQQSYLNKVLKCFFISNFLLNTQFMIYSIKVFNFLGFDYQKEGVRLLRGFPNQLIYNIRHQPSAALLSVMSYRHSRINVTQFEERYLKGKYMERRLLPELENVGKMSDFNNYWLFPILVDNPKDYVATIRALGINAYHGVTQLNLVTGDNQYTDDFELRFPYAAKYLIDHVVYLPFNKYVPYSVLDEIIKRAKIALRLQKHTPKIGSMPSLQFTSKL